MTKDNMWDKLIELGISEDTIRCTLAVAGNSTETYEAILYWATGYQDFEQLEN